MEINEALKMGNDLMQEHGLIEKGWKLKTSHAKRICGHCCYSKMTLKLSRYYIELNPSYKIRNTLLGISLAISFHLFK